MNEIFAFGSRDGTAHFTCMECKIEVYRYGGETDFPICYSCKFIGEHPQLPEETKRLLRGDCPLQGETKS